MGSVHIPTLLEGILEATAAEAQAKARITTIRAALEDEARRRFAADGAAPSWNTPALGKVRLEPAGDWTARVAEPETFGSYVAERHPTEATVVIEFRAEDAGDVMQALEFIEVDPVRARVEVRPAWAEAYLKGLALDVTEERDASAQLTRTVVAADKTTGDVVPGIGVTRAEAKLVVSLDRDRRTAAITEARSTADALVAAASDEADEEPVDLAALHARRQELEALNADVLATIANGHGLGKSGSKASLAERIARAELATGNVIRPATSIGEPPSPLPEGTEVEEVTTLPAHAPEAPIVDQPVEEVPDAGDVADAHTPYDDEVTRALEALASREVLRGIAKARGLSAAGTKTDVAARLAAAGITLDEVRLANLNAQERTA